MVETTTASRFTDFDFDLFCCQNACGGGAWKTEEKDQRSETECFENKDEMVFHVVLVHPSPFQRGLFVKCCHRFVTPLLPPKGK